MPERNKEELQQIHKDLLELKKTLNWLNSFGDLWPTPMNGKTWQEEKDEFYNRGIKAFQDLVRFENVKSCELRSVCKYEGDFSMNCKVAKGFWNHIGRHPYDSSEYKFDDEITLDSLIETLEKVLDGNGSKRDKAIINQTLDNIGNAACQPRALNQVEDQTNLAYNKGSIPLSTQSQRSRV